MSDSDSDFDIFDRESVEIKLHVHFLLGKNKEVDHALRQNKDLAQDLNKPIVITIPVDRLQTQSHIDTLLKNIENSVRRSLLVPASLTLDAVGGWGRVKKVNSVWQWELEYTLMYAVEVIKDYGPRAQKNKDCHIGFKVQNLTHIAPAVAPFTTGYAAPASAFKLDPSPSQGHQLSMGPPGKSSGLKLGASAADSSAAKADCAKAVREWVPRSPASFEWTPPFEGECQ